MNLANYISLYRIIAAPILFFLILNDYKNWFSWLLIVSLLSDVADGIIARRYKMVSKLGAQLDSIGDVLTFITAIVGVWKFESDFLIKNHIIVLVTFLPYILQIIVAVIVYGKPSSFHTYLAKAAAFLQGTFLIVLFLFGPLMWLFYFTALITILEIIEEFILVFILPEWRTDVKGLYWVLKQKNKSKRTKKGTLIESAVNQNKTKYK